MRLTYTIINPTGNITLLVTSPVPRAMQPQVAAWLLRRMPRVEQVGFLEPSAACAARLQMMGGEFCGNGTMALGAWLCRRDKLPAGARRELVLEVSGAPSPVACAITRVRGCYVGTVSMPLPDDITSVSLALQGMQVSLPVVFLPGICHVIVSAEMLTRPQAEEALRRWAELLPREAVGLLLWDEPRSAFAPLVYVKGTDSAVWEQCCGSGSAAIGAYLTALRGAPQHLSLRQSGGSIAVITNTNGEKLSALTITGTVTLERERTVDVVF